ncbi:pyruvate kinase [Desulfohalotomaculum tongense]|uniref:pyruvate kinase n=1 Tax=Desulforadius tongensis TaxID=1216062 RepID=UPI00195E4B3C|nr:pyruvate kinase [Desulforadius tongensis]MBM7855273.1 pyruvate kinase [Desulforadius tongensis]
MRRTKIVCTIGPASEDVEILKKMIRAGMNVARMNFSHGTHEDHARRISLVRQAAAEVGKNIAIMLDTKGPEIRLGVFAEEPILLRAGDEFILTTEEIQGDNSRVSVTYKDLPRDVTRGGKILVADGLIELEVIEINDTEVRCKVVNGGELKSRKGVNLPGVQVNLPALTEKDIEDILFGIEHQVDFIAASFIRNADNVLTIRKILEENNADIDIISKIENREAVDKFDEILKVSNGIMVARGDLGVEIPAEDVPMIQKTLIAKCNLAGKPVITATQMLESMTHNPRPTRAEASDVANAILDGTDAIMLSGESAAGKYPVEAVETMNRIAVRVEKSFPYGKHFKKFSNGKAKTVTDGISSAVCSVSADLEAAAILSATASGHTARMISKYRPRCPIVAVTPNPKVLRKMALVWGVEPLLVRKITGTDEMIAETVEVALASGIIKAGDLVVITAGVPVGIHGTTNLLKVHTVGNILARGTGIGSRAVTGQVKVCRTVKDAREKIKDGDIMVTVGTDKDFVPYMEKCSAVVTEEAGLTSHAAIVGLNIGIPVVVGVDGATGIIPDGEMITVDGPRGLIYIGTARVM